uniref:MCM3-associated protein n=1 Tax=Aceria tosichella TaxID=561515 RepID=A0A6G1S8H7_9ACAR
MTFQGSCSDMCPEAERQFRFGLSMSIFEKDNKNQPDEYAMVKEYRRSSADQKEPASGDLRTPEALNRTMDYLVCNIMDDPRSNTQELALEWYDFLWDRLRAIRKDITQQNICDQASATLVERCARFHVHSCYAMSGVKNFDVDMNKRNLNDCLQMLRQMYTDLRMTSGTICSSELEFQIYDILLHLNDDHLASIVLMKTSDYRSTSEMKFITDIVIAYTNNDYYKFFQLMAAANYMTSCILSLYSNKMRLAGLKSIINACAPRQTTLYPFGLAVKSLGFDDDDDLKMFAARLEIDVQDKNGECFLCLNRDLMNILRRNDSLSHFKSRHLVEDKSNGLPVGLLVDGRDKLPPNPYRAKPILFQKPILAQIEEERSTSMEFQEEQYDEHESEASFSSCDYEQPSPPKLQPQYPSPVQSSFSSPFSWKAPVSTSQSPKMPPPPPSPSTQKSTSLSSTSSPLSPLSLSPRKSDQQNLELVEYPSINEHQEESQITILSPSSTEESDQELKAFQRELELKALERERKLNEARKEETARIMPAGRYKERSLKAKVPTLRLPSMSNGHSTPAKRPKPMSAAQRDMDSIIAGLEDEARTNEMIQSCSFLLGLEMSSRL